MKRNKSRNTTIASLVLILIVFALRMMLASNSGDLLTKIEKSINVLEESTSVFTTEQDDSDRTNGIKAVDEKAFVKGYVEYVIDGDTAWINIDGEDYKVRFIGVDTPEGDEEMYQEATDYTKEMIEEKIVYLEVDQSDKDQYGRLLRYIWLEIPVNESDEEIHNKMFNPMLLEKGLAEVMFFDPNTKYKDYFELIVEK